MVTAFPAVLIGFEWYKKGLNLFQVISCAVISSCLLLAYSIPAAQLGAKTGLSYTALSRSIFGRLGSWYISFNVIWLFTGAYGLMALYMSESIVSLFHWKVSMPVLSAVFAVLMSANNIFGFKGIANFAKYIAAPALIAWIVLTFVNAVMQTSPLVMSEPSELTFAKSLSIVSSFVIGFGAWGNEMDYWRYSKPQLLSSAIPLTVSVLVGLIIFPLAGWLLARATGISDSGAATAFMIRNSFSGMPLLALIVLGSSYFATNDSNLFGCAQACDNLKQIGHRQWTLINTAIGAIFAFGLAYFGTAKSIEFFTTLNCIFLPTPTVIMIAEWLIIAQILKKGSISNISVPPFSELPLLRAPAAIALLLGTGFGLMTAGIIPGTEGFKFGVPSIQAWLVAFFVYLALRIATRDKELAIKTE